MRYLGIGVEEGIYEVRRWVVEVGWTEGVIIVIRIVVTRIVTYIIATRTVWWNQRVYTCCSVPVVAICGSVLSYVLGLSLRELVTRPRHLLSSSLVSAYRFVPVSSFSVCQD